jgi:hypothetical protein
MRRALLLILSVLALACDIQITTGPTGDITNTNTNNNTFDIHDLVNFAPMPNPSVPVPAPGGGTETPVAIPAASQGIANGYAAGHPTQLAQSCQQVYGQSAWAFMDGLVLALKASDQRWGYMVKASDGTISRDVIAYRGTSDNSGAWGVDVIVDHCGTPSFAWNVLGFDPAAQWAAVRF